MDENQQDNAASKTPATEAEVTVPSEKKVGMPKRENQWPTTPAKWIELLGSPLTILVAIVGLLWGVYQFNAQQQSTQQQALDQQQQTTLETYLDRMSDLLIPSDNKQGLHESKRGNEMRQVARARTLTALQNLDSVRKGILLEFLYQSGLIEKPSSPKDTVNPIIDMSDADLSGADLHEANLFQADLDGANLSDANLKQANLLDSVIRDSNLSRVHLEKAILFRADLRCSNLSGAFLINTNLSDDTNLGGANLNGADVSGTNLSDAQLKSLSIKPDGTGTGGICF